MRIEKEFLFFKRLLPKTELGPLTRRVAYKTARPAWAHHPLGALERTERVVTAARARRAASAARPAASGYDMNHDKVFTVSIQGARQTYLTWSRAPT
jgi:hypothetical protein